MISNSGIPGEEARRGEQKLFYEFASDVRKDVRKAEQNSKIRKLKFNLGAASTYISAFI